jgi:uncharacterized membrane protein YqhA
MEKNKETFLKKLELVLEKALWNSRIFTLFAVIPSLVASFTLFIIGSKKIFKLFEYTFLSENHIKEDFYKFALETVITSVDIYLIATIMIIFSLGLYELFVSRIDAAENSPLNLLNIKNLEDLKEKLAKVILMVLIVSFFKYATHLNYNTPKDILMLAISIGSIGFAMYISHKH